jgi:Flp pilus assembly protein TadB
MPDEEAVRGFQLSEGGRGAWLVWRFLALVVLAACTGYLAWYLHSLSVVAFFIAILVLSVVQLGWDWWRLGR